MPNARASSSPCAGARSAAGDGPEVIHAVVTRDYKPSGRILARRGEHVRLLEQPGEFHVWVYREGKKYGRLMRSDHLRVIERDVCGCRSGRLRVNI